MMQHLSTTAKKTVFERLKGAPGLKTAKALMIEKASIPPLNARRPIKKSTPTSHTDQPSTIPFYQARVAAGAPTLIDESFEQPLNLHEHLVSNAQQTFCVRVQGDSMIGAGIQNHDLLVVSSQQKPQNGDIVVAAIDNELSVKRLKCLNNQVLLLPENPKYTPLVITEFMTFKILGVVQHAIHSF